jgi:hypothetical protein
MIFVRIFLLILFFTTGSFTLHAQTLESAIVANGATSDITGSNNECRRITNACGGTIMVPSKTNAEWTSYYGGAKPSCVTIASCAAASCPLPWGGTLSSGSSVTAWTGYGSNCASQTRTCTNGALSGTYTLQGCNCNPDYGRTCSDIWYGFVNWDCSLVYSSGCDKPGGYAAHCSILIPPSCLFVQCEYPNRGTINCEGECCGPYGCNNVFVGNFC